MKEFIICAANHYDDGKVHPDTPKNIYIGFVVCGRRHFNCSAIFDQITGLDKDMEILSRKKAEKNTKHFFLDKQQNHKTPKNTTSLLFAAMGKPSSMLGSRVRVGALPKHTPGGRFWAKKGSKNFRRQCFPSSGSAVWVPTHPVGADPPPGGRIWSGCPTPPPGVG